MRSSVIIVAAGKGARAPGDIPKQYRTIGHSSVISASLSKFYTLDHIVVVINPEDRILFDSCVGDLPKNVTVASGGATRTDSVKAGLEALKDVSPDYVLIHDAARPFVSAAVINGVVDALTEAQAAVPVLPIVDAVKTLEGDAVDRDALRRFQTPQGFHYFDIYTAYSALEANSSFADDIEVARHAGMTIAMPLGDPNNIKLTYPHDFEYAERLMTNSPQQINITGSGYDVHRLVDGDGMWLCGVRISGKLSLLGHSDADVGLHALTDAILGAVALGDIGDHFPPSDERWHGASSDIFLKHAVQLAGEQGAKIVHVDVTLICEEPKIKPYREAMRARISELLGLPLTRVSVKATTTEGLGFTGRAEGIAAQATATLAIPANPL